MDFRRRCREALVRRVCRGLHGVAGERGRQGVRCRQCVEVASDQAPKTRILNWATKGRLRGSLTLTLTARGVTGDCGDPITVSSSMEFGPNMNQKVMERDLYKQLWQQALLQGISDGDSDAESCESVGALMDTMT